MSISAQSAAEIIGWLEDAQVAAWVDGGWAVDAAMGRQSREHDDLDLVIGWEHIDTAREALARRGFSVVRDDEWPCSFVLGDRDDRRVDIHPVRFDEEGAGWQAQPNGQEWRYPPEGFVGVGTILGQQVRCLAPMIQLLCHYGYELDEGDKQDMRLLAEHFGLDLPARFH